MGSGMSSEPYLPENRDATAGEQHSGTGIWWQRINEPWMPGVHTVRVACGLLTIMLVLIALFRHRAGAPALVSGRVLLIAYGALGVALAGRMSSFSQRIYVSILAVSLPLFALYASLIAHSSPETLSFVGLAILCPLFFMMTINDLLVVVIALIAGHGIFMSRFPEPDIGLANHWILWISTILLGAAVSFSLLLYRANIRRSERLLARARDQAVAESQARSELLASMGDEIRTPMNGITGLIDLVLDTKLDEEQRRYLEMVKYDADRLTNVLSDLLDLAKMHANWLKLEVETFNLPDLLRATLTPMALRAEDKKVSLEWEMPRNLPVWVRGDPRRLRQILVNLVNYIIEVMRATQVSVVASRTGTRQKRNHIKIEIRDAKTRLSEEQLEAVHKALERLDAPPAKTVGSSSLGLAICSQLVSMMDGEIRVSSNSNGTTFSFTARLPMDEAKEKEWVSKSSRSQRDGALSANVLVVEDNPTNRVFAERVLQKAGHNVTTAKDGQEALERMTRQEFDIVFMDILMPVMNGLEAAQKIRENERSTGARVPIVALTAHVLEEQRRQCLDAGMDVHLGKPVHGSDLLDVIHRLVEGKDENRATESKDRTAKGDPDNAPSTELSTELSTVPATSVPATSASADELPVFVLERLLDMLDGDRTLIREMLDEFTVQRSEILDQLRQALEDADTDAGSKLAHKLKGSLLALCADASAAVAKELELSLRQGDLARGKELSPLLDAALDTLQAEFAALGLTKTDA
jgi:signal transduction histidine kinase/CheY-like chemotaxis protein/HPt (histidine-containing phosphotransfer) domain-containing protein